MNSLVVFFDQPECYEFLLHVFEAHVRKGLPGEHLEVAALTRKALLSAQELPTNLDLGKAKLELTPTGVALETIS